MPRWSAIWRKTQGTLSQFFSNAIPIFLVITIVASVLPPEAALPVILASIRKDGLLLFAEPDTLAVLTPLQILTGVYLAGVLLPCLVTALTIAREQSVRFAVGLMARSRDRRDRFFDASGLGRHGRSIRILNLSYYVIVCRSSASPLQIDLQI